MTKYIICEKCQEFIIALFVKIQVIVMAKNFLHFSHILLN